MLTCMLERVDRGLDRLESVPEQRAVYQVLCSIIPESMITHDQDFSRPPAPWIQVIGIEEGRKDGYVFDSRVVLGLDEVRSQISKLPLL